MRIAFLVQGLETPRTRYRVRQYLPLFHKQEVETRVINIPRGTMRRLRDFRSLDEFDVVVLQKRLFSAFDFHYIRNKAKRLVFDVDDAIMVKPDAMPKESRRRRVRFERAIAESDLVFAGNSYLMKVVQELGAKAILIPTCIDLNRYPASVVRPSGMEGPLHLGWIGSQSTLPYLEELKPIFRELGQKPVPMDLTIICNTFFDDCGMPVCKKIWSSETEVRDLMGLDIGLAPLPENPWTIGKSATKVVQYMAAGLPVITSPVGANAEIVQDGVNGFHAKDIREWVDRILSLAEHRDQRIKMGIAGRQLVEKSYSVQGVFPRMYEGLKGLVLQQDFAVKTEPEKELTAASGTAGLKTDQPLVSITIPAHNHEAFVQEAIDSVMKQSYRNIEVMVIDDGSTDKTWEKIEEACKKYDGRIRAVSHENQGLVRTLNLGIRLSKGKYWCQMASDDMMHERNIELKVNFLERNPDYDAVCSDALVLKEDLSSRRMMPEKSKPDPLQRKNLSDLFEKTKMFFPSLLFRKPVFDNIGYFDESMRYYEDKEMKLRLLMNCKVGYIDEPLLTWRSHVTNTSMDMVISHREKIIAYEKIFSLPMMKRHPLLRQKMLGKEYYKYARCLLESGQSDQDHSVAWYLFRSILFYPFRYHGYYYLMKWYAKRLFSL